MYKLGIWFCDKCNGHKFLVYLEHSNINIQCRKRECMTKYELEEDYFFIMVNKEK